MVGQGVYRDCPLIVDGVETARPGTYVSTDLTDYALQWLEESDDGRPFCLVVAHKAVHHEFEPPDDLLGAYDDVAVDLPDEAFTYQTLLDRNVWEGTAGRLQASYRRYCETLLGMDREIGRLLDAIDPQAARIGAVNTVVRGADGRLTGYNTDAEGFLEPLRSLLNQRHLYRMARILGAGGAAEGVQRAELIEHQGGDLLRRAGQVAAAEGGGGIDADQALGGAAQRHGFGAGQVQLGENAPRALGKGQAGRGDPHLARQAFEQGGLQFFFKMGDLVAERRLHDVAALRGTGEVALLGQRDRELELLEVHRSICFQDG